MKAQVKLKLFATLNRFTPESADRYPIEPGISLRVLLTRLGIPIEEVNLIFINDRRGNLNSTLSGGESVSIFPPLGGG